MTLAVGVFDRASNSLGDALPRIGAGLLLLAGGLLLAWVLGRLVARGLTRAGLDRLAERVGIHDVLVRVGLQRSLSGLIGKAVRIALAVVVFMAAIATLGLDALSESLNSAVLFLPKLFVALSLLLIGVVLGDFLRKRVERGLDQMSLDLPLGRAAQAGVISVFVLTALAQLGVSTTIVTVLGGIVLITVALAFALAFGLGGRDVARQLSASRYVSGGLELGQTIDVAGASGEIIGFESAAVILRAADGGTLRVPNHLVLESVVAVEADNVG